MGESLTAKQTVQLAMEAVLPPGVPPCFREITSAHFRRAGRRKVAVADVIMFDGRSSTVEVWRQGFCTVHRWTLMPGGNAYWTGSEWRRDAVDQDIAA